MFESNSRYLKCPVVETEDSSGETVQVVKLRRLPYVDGLSTPVAGTDRLDVMAHRRYDDGTKFWHIADANSELEANALVTPPSATESPGEQEIPFIVVPEN